MIEIQSHLKRKLLLTPAPDFAKKMLCLYVRDFGFKTTDIIDIIMFDFYRQYNYD